MSKSWDLIYFASTLYISAVIKRRIYKEDQLLNQDDRPTDQSVVCSLELTVSTSTSSLLLYFCSQFLSPLPGVEAQRLARIFLRLFHLQMLKFVMIVMSVHWDFSSNVNVKKRKKSSLKDACYWAADVSQSCRTNQMTNEKSELKRTKPN